MPSRLTEKGCRRLRVEFALVFRLVALHQLRDEQPSDGAGEPPTAGVERIEDAAGGELSRHLTRQGGQFGVRQVMQEEDGDGHVEAALDGGALLEAGVRDAERGGSTKRESHQESKQPYKCKWQHRKDEHRESTAKCYRTA